jgi:hypothetical protein
VSHAFPAHLYEVFSGHADQEEAEKWRRIGDMLREYRNIEMICSTGEPHRLFWETMLEYAREVLAKAENWERVRTLG